MATPTRPHRAAAWEKRLLAPLDGAAVARGPTGKCETIGEAPPKRLRLFSEAFRGAPVVSTDSIINRNEDELIKEPTLHQITVEFDIRSRSTAARGGEGEGGHGHFKWK